ncbi:MAG: XRE family transcriptional regulator [Variovorax paradoxus]|uniref:XRE family transcriptional regulator n=1 Tax=Variovorax paradoxus TaxID=34073 RepID=A0A2W5QTG2_VARPD|nr:MAG: XRE family transcriptional regulator [Variovorax paradoxus]
MESVEKVRADLARNLRMLRAAARVTQEDLAHRANLQRSQISQIEQEQGNPSLKTLCQLADAFDLVVCELLSPSLALNRRGSN